MMNPRLVVGALTASVLVGFIGGYFIGGMRAKAESNKIVEGLALNGLANSLYALRFIEGNEVADAKRLLQAETNGQLSWIIELAGTNNDPEHAKQRCKTLNSLKQYRQLRNLFNTSEWEYLWKVPDMKIEEDRRVKFLSELDCGSDRLVTFK